MEVTTIGERSSRWPKNDPLKQRFIYTSFLELFRAFYYGPLNSGWSLIEGSTVLEMLKEK